MIPLRDSIRWHKHAPVTILLLVANVLVFLWQSSLSPEGFEASVFHYGFIPRLFFSNPLGESYRLLSSMFLHGNLGHILGNMWFLWVFGRSLEHRLGSQRYLGLYLLTGIAAALLQGLFSARSIVPMIGASGAVSGVLGAYFLRFPRASVLTLVWIILPFVFWLPASLYLGYWALIQLFYGFSGVGGVAWWAHVGGFVAGLWLVRNDAPPARQQRYRSYIS